MKSAGGVCWHDALRQHLVHSALNGSVVGAKSVPAFLTRRRLAVDYVVSQHAGEISEAPENLPKGDFSSAPPDRIVVLGPMTGRAPRRITESACSIGDRSALTQQLKSYLLLFSHLVRHPDSHLDQFQSNFVQVPRSHRGLSDELPHDAGQLFDPVCEFTGRRIGIGESERIGRFEPIDVTGIEQDTGGEGLREQFRRGNRVSEIGRAHV